MNYKELFNKMAFLLSSPSRFWEKEATEGQGSRMMSEYVYPLIGLCGLSEFIGTFIGRDVSTEFFQWALTRCCAIAVSLFSGFLSQLICWIKSAGTCSTSIFQGKLSKYLWVIP